MPERAEHPSVNLRLVVIAAGGTLMFLAASVAVLATLFPEQIHRRPPVLQTFPVPSVTTDEAAQRILLEQAQMQRLSGKTGGMPIEQAMSAIAAKGAAAFDPVTKQTP